MLVVVTYLPIHRMLDVLDGPFTLIRIIDFRSARAKQCDDIKEIIALRSTTTVIAPAILAVTIIY